MGKTTQRLLFSLQILFALLLQVATLYAQPGYSIQHYSNENGLPANGIKGIELDKKTGFLWVGTQAGLVRFDGQHFKSFKVAKNMAPNRISAIGRDKEGTIYCGDDNFSIYRIINNKPEFVMTDSVFMNPYMFWAGNSWMESAKYIAKALRRHQPFPLLPIWVVYNERPGNNKGYAFFYGGACYYNVTKDTLQCFPENRDFLQLIKVDGYVYYIRENLEVWEYDDNTMKLLPIPVKGMPTWNTLGERPIFIWQTGMEKAFLVYNKSIWEVQRAGNTLNLKPVCQECYSSDAHINAVQIWEEQGLIFLGSMVKGLYVVRKPFFNSISTDIINADKKGRAEYAQAEIIPGAITTSSGRSFSFQGKLLPQRTTMEFHAYTSYKDKNGDYWFHSSDTIIHFTPQNGRYKKIAVNDRTVRMFFAETRGHLYVVSNIAIAEISEDKYRLKYKLPINVSTKYSFHPDAVIEWQPGVLAIAGEKLLFFNTEKGEISQTISIPGLRAKVRALLKYRDYLLIGTYGEGFYIYKNGVVKKMPLDRKEYLSYLHCFKLDDKGFCWMSTNHGLFKVSLRALIAAYEKNLDEIYYHYFGKEDGLLNTEFNGGCQPCMLELSNGSSSFPNMNGLTLFNAHEKHVPPPSGQVFVDEILVDSTVFHLNDNPLGDMPYDIKNLRFKLSLPYFGNPENIYFSYKLEPFNDVWEQQDITQNNTLVFGRLKPGSYKLYLRVRNGFEPDQFKITVINFRILPPWYQTAWFYIVCVLALAALFWGLVKWRTARIEQRKEELQQLVTKQTKSIAVQSTQLENQLTLLQTQQIKLEDDNKIKSRLISIISHDMISPLKFMSYLSEMALGSIASSDKNYDVIEYMASVAKNMESLTVNLLNWIRFHHESQEMEPEKFNLYNLIKESVKIASTLAQEKGINIIIDIPEGTEVFQFKQAVGVIVYNLTMNAAKYTATGAIRITSHHSTHEFAISIADTGPGMPAETVEKLNDMNFFDFNYSATESKKYQFGYVIVKDLLSLSNGNMKVESSSEKGTIVTITFKEVNNKVSAADKIKQGYSPGYKD
jgi:signal transduction histidine kinase